MNNTDILLEKTQVSALPRQSWADREAAEFLEKLQAQWPRAFCELKFRDDFDCLIAIMLSARATDKQVNRVTAQLFAHGRSPEDLLRYPPAMIEAILRPLGLTRQKTRYLLEIAAQVQRTGVVGDGLNDLMALPGVGRKTAQVFLSLRRQQPTFPVDTHIFRICHRTQFVANGTFYAVEQALRRRLLPAQAMAFHLRMVLHGRYICKARTPECQRCLLSDFCVFFNEQHPQSWDSKRETR